MLEYSPGLVYGALSHVEFWHCGCIVLSAAALRSLVLDQLLMESICMAAAAAAVCAAEHGLVSVKMYSTV